MKGIFSLLSNGLGAGIDMRANLRFTISIRGYILQSLFLMGNFYQDTFQAFEQG
jgi:hypothetical protein